jgi:nitrite reductase/ring-hydroxylating ferredoxin subunit
MHAAPAADAFPAYPASWYLLCRSRELRRGPVSRDLLGRQLVAYRTQSGRIAVLDGRCAHLGARLGGGRVIGESVQCPYHNWEYGRDGRCTRIPGLAGDPPRFARLTAYPAEERCGYVFVFNGPEPLFPLPFFFDADPADLMASRPFRFVAGCSWYLFASHAFDSQHFFAVHDRRLLGPPQVDCPAAFARRNRYTALIEGTSVYDRLLRTLVSRTTEISITTWGGTLFFLTGNFGRVLSRFLIAARPIGAESTLAEGVVFTRRGRNPLTRAFVRPLSLWVRWLFTRGYLRDEASRLGSPRYNPSTMVEGDRDMIDFFHWMAEQPQNRPQWQTAEPTSGDSPMPAPRVNGAAGRACREEECHEA